MKKEEWLLRLGLLLGFSDGLPDYAIKQAESLGDAGYNLLLAEKWMRDYLGTAGTITYV